MLIFNADGSIPEMCGNGIRCLARFIADQDNEQLPRAYRVVTGAGLLKPVVRSDKQVAVDMGEPILTASKVPSMLPPTKVHIS